MMYANYIYIYYTEPQNAYYIILYYPIVLEKHEIDNFLLVIAHLHVCLCSYVDLHHLNIYIF